MSEHPVRQHRRVERAIPFCLMYHTPMNGPNLLDPIICQGIPGRHPPFFYLLPFFSLCLPPFFGAPFRIFCEKVSFAWKSLSRQKFKSKSLSRWKFKSNWFTNPQPHCFHFMRWLFHWMGGGGGGRCLFHWLGGGGGVCGSRRCSAGGPKDCDASSVWWVVVAVAVQKGLHRHLVIWVLCLFSSYPKFTRRPWYCSLHAFPVFHMPPLFIPAFFVGKFSGGRCHLVRMDWHCLTSCALCPGRVDRWQPH